MTGDAFEDGRLQGVRDERARLRGMAERAFAHRKKAETDSASSIAYDVMAHEYLDTLLAELWDEETMAKQGEERCNDCAGLMQLHPMPDCRSYGHALAGGAGEERARIVAWLRSYDDAHLRSALADRIERCEHVSGASPK